MKLTVYSEAFVDMPVDGAMYRFAGGEDTLPYVDDRVFFVADGIGGCSSTRHRQFNKDLFHPDKQFETLFDGILEEEADAYTREYLRRCFADFVGNQPYFEKVMAARRKSSFYGARILSTLLLHKLRNDPSLHIYDGGIFDEYNRCDTAAKKKEYLQGKADDLGAYLHSKLIAVADKAGFSKDKSKSSAIVMFGTTLCFTIVRENPEEQLVEALYFVAGDSRPYAIADYGSRWGMFQTVADCEEADGAMTSCVCAEERVPLKFMCAYRKFKTPCVLFNASDGCFDSGAFVSQLTFEKVIYDSICGSDSLEQVSEQLTDFFSVYGRHDDCSTMSMRFFGFDSFGEVKAWAETRLADLNTRYLSKDPELLDHDYATELEAFRAESFSEQFATLVPAALDDTDLIAFVGEVLRNKKSPDFNQDFVDAIKAEQKATDRMQELKAEIIQLLRDNLGSLPSLDNPTKNWIQMEDLKEQIRQKRAELTAEAQKVLHDLTELVAAMDSIKKCDPSRYVLKDTRVQTMFEDLIGTMSESRDLLVLPTVTLRTMFEDLKKTVSAFYRLEQTEAPKKTYTEHVQGCAEELLEGTMTVESLELAPADSEALKAKLKKYGAEQEKQSTAQTVMAACVKAYVEAHMRRLAEEIYAKTLKAGKELTAAVAGVLDPLKQTEKELEKKVRNQVERLESYDKIYYSVINHHRRGDAGESDDTEA